MKNQLNTEGENIVKKRLLAMLLCVTMVASLLTVGAVADNAPIAAIDGAVMEHTVDIGELSDDEATYRN